VNRDEAHSIFARIARRINAVIAEFSVTTGPDGEVYAAVLEAEMPIMRPHTYALLSAEKQQQFDTQVPHATVVSMEAEFNDTFKPTKANIDLITERYNDAIHDRYLFTVDTIYSKYDPR